MLIYCHRRVGAMLENVLLKKTTVIKDLSKRLLQQRVRIDQAPETIQGLYNPLPKTLLSVLRNILKEDKTFQDPDHTIRYNWKKNSDLRGISYVIDGNRDIIETSVGYDHDSGEILVNIADVSKYLFDHEDFRNFVFHAVLNGLTDGIGMEDLHMLPRHLTTSILSMNSRRWFMDNGGDVIQVAFQINQNGEIDRARVHLAKIQIPEFLTGEQMYRALFEQNDKTLTPIYTLLSRFRSKRSGAQVTSELENSNCVSLKFTKRFHTRKKSMLEPNFVHDNSYPIVGVLAEEARIAANVAVAFLSSTQNFKVLYRISNKYGDSSPSESVGKYSRLGVPCYCNISSPITKAIDLINSVVLKIGIRSKLLKSFDLKYELNTVLGRLRTKSFISLATSLHKYEEELNFLNREIVEPYLLTSNMEYHSIRSRRIYKVRVSINTSMRINLANNEYLATIYVEDYNRYFYNGIISLADNISLESVVDFKERLLTDKIINNLDDGSISISVSSPKLTQVPQLNSLSTDASKKGKSIIKKKNNTAQKKNSKSSRYLEKKKEKLRGTVVAFLESEVSQKPRLRKANSTNRGKTKLSLKENNNSKITSSLDKIIKRGRRTNRK